jgi:hypothetical protein
MNIGDIRDVVTGGGVANECSSKHNEGCRGEPQALSGWRRPVPQFVQVGDGS